MSDFIVYFISLIATKIIKYIRLPIEMKLLGNRNEDYNIAYDLYFLVRELFLNGQFSNAVMSYSRQHGSMFILWFLKYYSIIVCLLTFIFLLIGKCILNTRIGNSTFYLIGLSPLFIIMFLMSTFKGILYGRGKLKLASIAMPISNIVNFLCLMGCFIFSKKYMLVIGQLLYASIQCLWMFYFLDISADDKNNLTVFTSGHVKKIHGAMFSLLCSALLMWVVRIVKSYILSSNRGYLSNIKYSYDIIYLFIGLIGMPIIDILSIRVNKDIKNHKVIINSIIAAHLVCIFPSGFLLFSGGDILIKYIGKLHAINNLTQLSCSIKLLSGAIYLIIMSRICRSIVAIKGNNKKNLITKFLQALLELLLLFMLLRFSSLPVYVVVLVASNFSLLLQLILSSFELIKCFNASHWIIICCSSLFSLIVNYFIGYLHNKVYGDIISLSLSCISYGFLLNAAWRYRIND